MSKIAFLFPGQGAQYVGMGKDFYEAFPVCREVFEEASKASGLDIPALCFEENDKLNQTEYTQICMLAVEAAILKAVETQGIQSDVNAGLSLGEYGAVIASGVMSLEDAFRVVRQRGIYMQEAVPTGGAMTAVLGLDAKIIEKVCEEVEVCCQLQLPGADCDHRRREGSRCCGRKVERSRCKTYCQTECERSLPFKDACRSR